MAPKGYILDTLLSALPKKMIPFEIKAIIASDNGLLGDHTIYLFNKDKKILLPIKITQNAVDALLLAKEGNAEPRPHIHNTTKRLINILKGKVDRVIISGYSNEIYYAYIRVVQGKNKFDIDSKPSDAFAIALRTKSPIFADKKVVSKMGIKITPEMLQ